MAEGMNVKPAMIYFPGKSLVAFWDYVDLESLAAEIKLSPTSGFHYITNGAAGKSSSRCADGLPYNLFLLNNWIR